MKNLLIVFLLAFLALSETLLHDIAGNDSETAGVQKTYSNNSGFTRVVNTPVISTHNFRINYNSSERNLIVRQKIVWRNLTNKKTNIIFLGLPANSFLNGKSLYFAHQEFDPKWKGGYKFGKIETDGRDLSINFIKHRIYKEDKSVGYIELNKNILPGDSVEIILNYKMKIPQGTENFGYSKGGNFCLLADWHPYVIQFRNGEWSAFHRSKIYQPEADNSVFYVSLSFDGDLHVVSSAAELKKDSGKILFKQYNGDALVFAFYSDLLKTDFKYVDNIGNEIEIPICLLPENERYLPRIKSVITNTLDYLTSRFGFYPFGKLSLVNVPDNTNFGFKSYSSMLTFYCDLFSPLKIQKPEYDIARIISKQYFMNYLNLHSMEDKWIEEGIPTYLSGKVMEKYYDRPLINFYLASYVPIYGFNLLSYNEIPIIYTLNDFYYSPMHRDIYLYYKYLYSNPVTDSTQISDIENFSANYSIKPALILNSIDESFGEKYVLEAIKELFISRNNQSLTRTFVESFGKYNLPGIVKFLEDGFYRTVTYDYAITGLVSVNDSMYHVQLARYGNGESPAAVYLYTDKDTLTAAWNGKNSKETLEFVTSNRVISAEIKPSIAGLLDTNHSNNSYTVNEKYWGSLSIAIRSFFWFQNALMIFGSIG